MSDSENLPKQKSCNFVILKEIGFWERILSIFKKDCFPYFVVYTDGYISCKKEDLSNRTPWGILIGNEIVSINEIDAEMTASEIDAYCSSSFFAGQDLVLPSFRTLKKIKRNVQEINTLIEELGGTPFKSYWYRSCESYSHLVDQWLRNSLIQDKTVRVLFLGHMGLVDNQPNTVYEMKPTSKSKARFVIRY